MNHVINQISDIVYSPEGIFDKVNQFKTLFNYFNANYRDFIMNQPTFLSEIRKKLKMEIGFLSPQKKEICLAVYGILLTEDLIEEYSEFHYAEDISTLLDATNKKDKCTEDEFVGLLTSFVHCIKMSAKALDVILENLCLIKIKEKDRDLNEMLLIKNNFLPALSEACLEFEVGEFQVDLRFITAIFAYLIEKKVLTDSSDKNLKSISYYYNVIKSKYPLSEGEDIYYDLIRTQLVVPYYPEIEKFILPKIESLSLQQLLSKIDKQEEIGEITSEDEKSEIHPIITFVSEIVEEVLNQNQAINSAKKQHIERNIAYLLMKSSTENEMFIGPTSRGVLIEIIDIWFILFSLYPQLALHLVNLSDYADYTENPENYLQTNRRKIMQQLNIKFRRYINSDEISIDNIAKAFAKILIEILSNPTTKTIDFQK